MKKILLLFIMINLLLSTAMASIPSEELAALDDLYQNTNGESWNQNDQWNDNNACNRFGVTCNTDQTHVLGIIMFGNNLQGSLPESLKNLTQLQTLVLANNTISGGIPSAIAYLDELTYLDLSKNRFSGNIPTDIWSSVKLTHLNLSDNQLAGELQINCNVVAPLQVLKLSNNHFLGNIPDCIGQITTLSSLYLSDNQFSGMIPSSLAQLTNLNNLYLDHNQLEGAIPIDIGELKSLQFLRLNYNTLSGEIPDELGYLGQLIRMDLSNNRLTGQIPATIGNLFQLERLYLNDNSLTGTLPAKLSQCTQLELLFISSNQFQGPIPEEFLSMTALQDDACEFRWNALWTNNASLKNFMDRKQKGDWEQTQTLAPTSLHAEKASETSVKLTWAPPISSNYNGSYEIYYAHKTSSEFQLFATVDGLQTQMFTLSIETGIPYYFKMKTILLPHINNKNRVDSTFSEMIPISLLSNISQLERNALIALYDSTGGLNWTNQAGWMGDPGSECSWYGVECNLDKDHIISIQLASNGLKNELPVDIRNLLLLERLVLRDNQLSGQIPEIISDLNSLTHLDFSANNFSGSIPDSLGHLNHLEDLLLYDNQLSGNIPTSLGLSTSLKRLYLEKNHLSGTLPTELGSLVNLEKIRVHSNQLMGEIPDEFIQLISLEYGRSDFRWNGLHSNNQVLIDFLNDRQRYDADWTETQNIAPSNFREGQALTEGMELLWTSIAYSVDPGSYDIYQSTSMNGPFLLYHSTSDKADSRLLLTDLIQSQDYFFRIRTCTQAHANNSNILESAFSPTIRVSYILHLPRISEIQDQAMIQNSYIDIPFSISDDIVSSDQLTIKMHSTNTGLVPLENMTISGVGDNRILRVSSVQNHVGETEITLTVQRDIFYSQAIFVLTVTPEEIPPPQPTGLHVTMDSGFIRLEWDIIENPYGVRYNVYRSTHTNGTFKCIHSEPVDMHRILAQDFYIDPNVVNGQLYIYKIKAVFNSIESAFSNAVQVRPQNVMHIKGDLNGDTITDIQDLLLTLQIISDIMPENFLVAHMNAFGNIGLDDAIYLIHKIVSVEK